MAPHEAVEAVKMHGAPQAAADDGPPRTIRQASIPVCGRTPFSTIVEGDSAPRRARRFVVEVGANIVRIEGVKVVAEQAGLRFAIFELLWRDFLAYLLDGASLDTFPARPISHIMREMEKRTERQYPDETTVRRAVNRLQADIEETVKRRLGLPIDRDDIVQTVRWSAQADENFGYRINPFTVAARPYQADLG